MAMATVVIGDTCIQSIMTIIRLLCVIVINCLRLFVFVIIVTMAMVVMGGMCVRSIYDGHTYYYQQLIGCYVGNGAL